ncbi:hypothetical protein GCK72_020916 [Caenorhabditis remanei]|uniref:DUF38 domain-containing protein n=1 Tax=Caenorhabditis remanei TaxID=31234 RepID=A0A6A5GI43_CAERE|nr:hypothetical protein GCK72_020916 [Caenorhabditis remanei]KAF1754356.1 hypothetical protein GCK72_020916 [Caenorhabditis remanei]
MSRSKPLAYQSSKAVLEYISFGKRKHLYAMCPAIRKMEENVPYHLELVNLKLVPLSMTRDVSIMTIDSFEFSFLEYEGNKMFIDNLSTEKRVDQLTSLRPEQAAEKFLLYNLSREGTRIKTVDLIDGPEFISECIPIAIKKLNVNRTAAWFPTNIPIENVEVDTTSLFWLKIAKHVTVRIPGPFAGRIHTEIVSEWNCESIRIESSMWSEEIADYSNKVSQRTDRLIGSRLIARHSSPVQRLIDILHSKMNARRTILNGRTCATISIDESTELNVYGSTFFDLDVIVEVCARGSAIDQVL